MSTQRRTGMTQSEDDMENKAVKEQAEQGELESLREEAMRKLQDGIQTRRLELLTAVDLRAYEEDVFSDDALRLAGKHTIAQRTEALRENLQDFIPRILDDAEGYEKQMASLLHDAVHVHRSLSESKAKSWFQKLAPLLYYKKKAFIKEEFPKWLKAWQDVADLRSEVMENPLVDAIDPSEIEDIDAFRDEARFLELPYPTRDDLAKDVDACVKAKEKEMNATYAETKQELSIMATGDDRYLHPKNIGGWLQRIFSYANTPEEVAACMETTVRPYAERWKEAREEFDTLDERTEEEGMPIGFHPLSLDAFLLLKYPARTTYLAHWEARLNEKTKHEPGRLGMLKSGIRSAFDTNDLNEALFLWQKAHALAPEDKDILAMEEYLAARGKDVNTDKERLNEDPYATLREMRDVVEHLPHTHLQDQYAAMLEGKNPRTFLELSRMREEAHERGELSETIEELDEKAITARKEQRQGGHEKEAQTFAEEAIVEHEQSQIRSIHVEQQTTNAFAEEIERRKDEPHFLRTHCYVPEGVTLAQHKAAIAEHQRLLRGLRTLERFGMRFTKAGKEESEALAM